MNEVPPANPAPIPAVPQIQALPHDTSAANSAISLKPKYMTAWLLSSWLGVFGADRFYLGRVWTGVFKLLTFGGYGIWAFVDVFLIAFGMLRTKDGTNLEDYEAHKKSVQVWTIIGLVVVPIIIVITLSVLVTVYVPKLLNGFHGVQGSNGGSSQQQDLLNQLNQYSL